MKSKDSVCKCCFFCSCVYIQPVGNYVYLPDGIVIQLYKNATCKASYDETLDDILKKQKRATFVENVILEVITSLTFQMS